MTLLGNCVTALLAFVASSSSAAQPPRDNAPVREVAPPGLRADIDYADVYVNDSFEASDALAKAARLAERGKWTEAAELFQATADTAGDKLVRVSRGHYVGIRRHVGDTIASWPSAGLTAYRALFDRRVEQHVEGLPTTKTVEDLLPLFERYFCTGPAAQVADAIGQLAIESGDFALAKRIYVDLQERHPDRRTHEQRYQAMLALLAAMRGENPRHTPEAHLRHSLRWMGEERSVREIIDGLGEVFSTASPSPNAADWPMFGGDANRNRLARGGVDELGLLWRYAWSTSPPPASHDGDLEPVDRAERDQRRGMTVFPVLAEGLVFLQRTGEVVALRRNSGVVAWRFRVDEVDQPSSNALDEPAPAWSSVTVAGGRVYASLPGDAGVHPGHASRRAALAVCLDAASGSVIWRVDAQGSADRLADVAFDSSPVVDGGRVYFVGRRRHAFGFEDCYLCGLSAADGSQLFRTHVGSASTSTYDMAQDTMAVATLHGDTVYVCTNLGAVAAVSAHTGSVRWLRVYRRATSSRTGFGDPAGEPMPWRINPVIGAEGRIVCAPSDAADLLILAEEDGRLIHSIPSARVGNMESLLGVQRDMVCCAGSEVACLDVATGTLRWNAALPAGATLAGRGLWVDDRLVIPMREGLSTFRVTDGHRVDVPGISKDDTGNVLVADDLLLVAGVHSLCAYVRKAQIWDALRRQMSAAPSDLAPALELAEVALRMDEFPAALEALEEAFARAGACQQPVDPSLRARLSGDVLIFLDTLISRNRLEPQVLEKLYRYASQCAPDSQAHIAYRFRFAEAFETRGQPDRALYLYQQVLRDRSLRDMNIGEGDSQHAGAQAQARIATLIDQHGQSLFAAYEAEARRWLESGRSAADLDALARVIETFPNSEAAAGALVAQGDLFLASDRPVHAAEAFARAYHRYPRCVDRPALAWKIANAYERGARLEQAYLWLTKGSREHPESRSNRQGRSTSFLEDSQRLAAIQTRVEPARPKLALPLEKHVARRMEAPVTLAIPRLPDHPTSDWSRCYVYAHDGIHAWNPRTGEELWPTPSPVRMNADLLVATSQQAVFATPYEVFSLDTATGTRRWAHGAYPEHLADAGADWENGQVLRAHAFHGENLVSVADGGLTTCIRISSGEVVWSRTHRPAPAGTMRMGERWLAFPFLEDGHSLVAVIDGRTGEDADPIRTGLDQPVEDILITVDGRFIILTSHTIQAYEGETLAQRWQMSFGTSIQRGSISLDLDALYLSTDGRHLQKIDLEEGKVMWRSGQIASGGGDKLTVHRLGGSLIASTRTSVVGIDAVTGQTLWEGISPKDANFIRRLATQNYVAAVDLPDTVTEAECTAYFYDHRNASGVLPHRGGVQSLGRLSEIREIMVTDDALIIQAGNTIHLWARP